MLEDERICDVAMVECDDLQLWKSFLSNVSLLRQQLQQLTQHRFDVEPTLLRFQLSRPVLQHVSTNDGCIWIKHLILTSHRISPTKRTQPIMNSLYTVLTVRDICSVGLAVADWLTDFGHVSRMRSEQYSIKLTAFRYSWPPAGRRPFCLLL